MRSRWVITGMPLLACMAFAMETSTALAQSKEGCGCQHRQTAPAAPEAQVGKLRPQTVCPIMEGKINKEVFVDVAGYRIYACCPSCLAKIEADPDKAVTALKAKGEKPELRLVVCPKCGEIKGAAQCCSPDAKKCPRCGLNNGSIGCCKNLKPPSGKQSIVICPKCGEIEGVPKCCKPDAQKCPKCGLNKGSIGCCRGLKPPADQQDVVICPKCGEIKGAAECCKPNAQRCPKCGLSKGAPGCCRIDHFTKGEDV